MGCHTLQHRSCSSFEIDFFGNGDETIRRDRCIFSVASADARISNTIADLDPANIASHNRYDPGCFLSVYKWERRRIPPFAKINIDEVNARGLNLDDRFIGFWGWNWKFDKGENFRAAGLRDLDSAHEKGVRGVRSQKSVNRQSSAWGKAS